MPTHLQSASVPALQPTYAPYPFPILRGEGDRVFDDQGNPYFDFYGGHCVCSTGHSHPKVAAAIAPEAFNIFDTACRLKRKGPSPKSKVHRQLEFGIWPKAI